MKKLVSLLLVVCFCFCNMGFVTTVPEHSAKGVVLMECTSKRVLYEHNAHERMPMASTTKIITALAIIKNCNINDIVTIDKRAVGVEGSSVYLTEGLNLTVRQLLYCLMLQSGNDSAVALAIHCSDAVEKFAKVCNDMCSDLGLADTHLTNPHGLHDDNHYISAYDLAYVSAVAMCNETFKEICTTKSIKIASADGNYERIIVNKNKLLGNMQGANGIKTGYTKRAGRCFVGSASNGDMQLVCALLNCSPMFENCQSLLEYGLSQYTMTVIVPQNHLIRGNLCGGNGAYLCQESFSYPIKNGSDELSHISWKVVDLCENNKINNYYQVFYDKQLLFLAKLVTI